MLGLEESLESKLASLTKKIERLFMARQEHGRKNYGRVKVGFGDGKLLLR